MVGPQLRRDKLKILKWSWRLGFAVVLALSIALNVAFFVGGSLYQAASSAFSAMTGVRTVAMQHADEVAELSVDAAEQRTVNRKLKGELSDVTGDLAAERMVSRQLRSDLADPGTRLVAFRGKKVAMRKAVDSTVDRISKRAMVTSGREVASMAGEAIPYVGISVIVAATAWELKDLCDTLIDMSELQRAFDPSAVPNEDEKTICAMKPPTKEEIWETAKSTPGEAWASAKEALPTLEEIKSYEFPDIDLEGAWVATAEGTGKAWGATKDGVGAAASATKSATMNLMERTKAKFLGDDETAVEE